MATLLEVIGVALQITLAAPVLYLYVLAIASARGRGSRVSAQARHRFAITIPAHNEAAVIGNTVARLQALDYPADRFVVHVVADNCNDATAAVARAAGAVAHERLDGPRGSKGAALRWLFERVLSPDAGYDAVVVFDADTHVAPDFLQIMDAHLDDGHQVIQGQHVIRNPEDGWFPALAWAMFLIDNRLQNLGRTVLGCSAKNMGDSICFRADVLRRLGWGEGLTEDYAFRQRLLLEGIKIVYDPFALGFGEAPLNWKTARTQRARWLRGSHDASKQYARTLLLQALRRRDPPLLDGALQAHVPAYSSLSVLSIAAWMIGNVVGVIRGESLQFVNTWSVLAGALFVYPLLGLALERAPLRAYVAILLGPAFIVWRTWLALTARLGPTQVVWVRTPRKVEHAPGAQSAGS